VTKAKKSGVSMRQLQQEASRLIESLNANTLFGIIQFSRSYDFFEDYLVTGTKANKEAGVFKVFTPTGNKEKDVNSLQMAYQTIKGKYPENQFPSFIDKSK